MQDQSSSSPIPLTAPAGNSAVPATSSTPYFTKLQGSCNYATWSFAMKMYLIEMELWDCITIPDHDVTDFKRKDAKARSKICLSLSEHLYPVVMSAKTSKETWEQLRAAYADSGLSRRLQLLKKLLGAKLTMYANVEAFINDIRHLQQQLIAIEAGLDEELIGVIMLAGLPDSYSPMVMAIEHSGTRITADSVASILLKEQCRDGPTTSSALPATVNNVSVCKYNKVSCSFCKKLGHVVSQCRKRINRNKKSSSSSHVANNTSDITLSSCFNGFPTGSPSSRPTDWYVDSGATSHMTNRSDWFQDLQQERKPITVANGQQIQSSGKVTLGSLLETDHYESLIKELTCTKCQKYMKPPIYLCVNGHSICGKCFEKSYQCHVCKKEFSQIRPMVLESLANKVLFPCTNGGCPKHATLTHLEKHSPHCQFRIIDCFMSRVYGECGWKGRAGDWMDHCFIEHKTKVTDLPFITVKDRWDAKRTEPVLNYFLLRCYEKVFNVYQIYDKRGGRMMWTVLVNDDEAEKFYFEVDLFMPSNPSKRIVYRRPCKCEKDADFLEHTQNVYIPVENVFSMLDEDEHVNFTVRIGEVENLPLLDTPTESESLIMLQNEEQKDN